MTLGWTVVVYRQGAYDVPEYWDCAIPSYNGAARAVRAACGAESVVLVMAYEPLSANYVHLLKLEDGQVRRRLEVKPGHVSPLIRLVGSEPEPNYKEGRRRLEHQRPSLVSLDAVRRNFSRVATISNETGFMRIAVLVAAIVFAAVSVMMLHQNSANMVSFGLGLSIGLLMAAVVALLEYVQRQWGDHAEQIRRNPE